MSIKWLPYMKGWVGMVDCCAFPLIVEKYEREPYGFTIRFGVVSQREVFPNAEVAKKAALDLARGALTECLRGLDE